MEDHQKPWSLDCLSAHSAKLFKTLIYEEHLVSKNLKYIEEFKTPTGMTYKGMKGYFANKDMTKYWIDEKYDGVKIIDLFPIRVGKKTTRMVLREDVVTHVLEPTPFKITPEIKIPVREMIEGISPFEHSDPLSWNLMKMIAVSGYVSQDFVCISTPSAFGKSAIYKTMNYLTNKCPVFKPRSVPGALSQITGTGNMVFDEAQKCDSKIREVMEDLSLRLADGSKEYINGALKAAMTKSIYDAHLQSITYLYNVIDNYSNPDKDYFDVVWVNPTAMRDRFLQLKFDGILTQKFTKDFDVDAVAEEFTMFYVNHAKTLLALQEMKKADKYVRRFERKNYVPITLTNRQRQTYDNITWIIDLVCHTEDEYNKYCDALDKSHDDYERMVSTIVNGGYVPSAIKSDDEIDMEDVVVEDLS